MEKEFEVLSHTADIGIIAYGSDMAGAFANAAKGMFSLIADIDAVRESIYRDSELTAPDRESLLVDWLNELVYFFDVDNIIFKKFEITRLTDTTLKARSYGEAVDSSRHRVKMGIKAVTYHMLKIDECNGARVQVLFDI